MNHGFAPPAAPSRLPLPRNVKVLGLARLLNDTASEMIYPLLPHFLLTVLLGNRFYHYENVLVGRAVSDSPDSPATVLCLPAVSQESAASVPLFRLACVQPGCYD
jgi:hypothetical protein